MANIVITSGTDYIKVVFNTYATALNITQGYWGKHGLEVVLASNGAVNVTDQHGVTWPLVYAAADGCFIVDTVDGAGPASNADLCDKLGVLVK